MALLKKLHPKAKIKGKIEVKDKKVTTCEFRLSYPNLFEAKEYKGKKSWGCQMLISKDLDISKLEIAAHNAAIEEWGSDISKFPSKKIKSKKTPGKIINQCIVEMPFRDGDTEKIDKPEFENQIFLAASIKKRAPAVCDIDRNAILDSSDIKAGDWCRASIIFRAYEVEGSYGVGVTLLAVQKIRDGESLGGGVNLDNEFDDLEPQDEDEESSSESEDEVEY